MTLSSSELPREHAPPVWPLGPVGLHAFTAPTRCRRCRRWLSLDEDDLASLWDDPDAGVVCWSCDHAGPPETPLRVVIS